jgi:type III secretory pathway component EscS
MVSTNTKITAAFVVLAVALWYGTTQVTESTIIQFAVLILVGAVLPIAITEWRKKSQSSD